MGPTTESVKGKPTPPVREKRARVRGADFGQPQEISSVRHEIVGWVLQIIRDVRTVTDSARVSGFVFGGIEMEQNAPPSIIVLPHGVALMRRVPYREVSMPRLSDPLVAAHWCREAPRNAMDGASIGVMAPVSSA